MTPSDLRDLASRVETEEPSEALRAAVLDAFGSEAEPGSEPDPLVSVDDAKGFQPDGWKIHTLEHNPHSWYCVIKSDMRFPAVYSVGNAPDEPRARTAAALGALAWEMENAGG